MPLLFSGLDLSSSSARKMAVHGHVVFGEVVIDEIAEAGIKRHLFMQCSADAEHHPANGLRPRRLRVQDTAGGEYAQHAPQPYLTGILIDADFGEMRAIGLLREILVVAARLDFTVSVHP